MNKEKYIIDDPKLETPVRRNFEWTITFLAWAFWIYFLAPIATLILWVVGIRLVALESFMLDHVAGLKSVIGYYTAGALVIWLIFSLWNWYNYKRFGHNDRRKPRPMVVDKELEKHFGVKADGLKQARHAMHVTIHTEGASFILTPH